MTLIADALTLATFVNGLFRYADEGTFVSWRAFRDDTKDAPPVFIAATQIPAEHALAAIAAAGVDYATRAAQHPFPAVFCPPIATFTSDTRAREVDLANGLALSVECDAAPAAARLKLEAILGPATVVVASGGYTDDGEAKLHLHWRLAEPTSDEASHVLLKRARIMATAIVGGDATNVPAVHPIRWPGSYHRKSTPRLATIVTQDLDRELVLSDAIEQLTAVTPLRTHSHPSIPIDGDRDTSTLVAQLLSGDAIHAPLVALAYRYLKGGMADGQVVLTLRGLMDAMPAAVRNRPDAPDRWSGHYKDIPRTVRTAREKIPAESPVQTVDFSELLKAPSVIVARRPERRDIPVQLLTPPGVLADIARYGIDSAVRPVPVFAVQAALALGSVVCGRRYMTSQRNYASLYFLNIAKSGTGKEEAKHTIEKILTAAGARRLLGGSSYSSGNAVFSALLKKPQHLTIIDEFGRYLEAASAGRDNFKADALTQLMEAFGRVHGDMATPQFSTMTLSAAAASNHEPKIIARPAITMLAMATPSTFYDSLRSTRILDGFLNRLLVVEHDAPRELMGDWADIPVPEAAVRWIKQILEPRGNLDVPGMLDHLPDPLIVELTPAALDASRAFERDMNAYADRLAPDGLGDMPIRAREIALRLALICSLSDAPDTPMVTVDCLDWAVQYVRFFLEQTVAAVGERVADTQTERTRNVVLNAVRSSGARGMTNRELNRAKTLIGLPHRDRRDTIESLLAAELVVWTDIPQRGPGHPRHALVAVEDRNSGDCGDCGKVETGSTLPQFATPEVKDPQLVGAFP